MAIFHLSAKQISRSSGRSATAAAAYRAGVEIVDERTGEVHDYSRKRGVLHSEIILPGGSTADRSSFWNKVEKHHKRGDAVIVREIEISLPTELTSEQRQALAVGFARELADRYGVAADVALHAPRTVTDKDLEKDPDQYHETDPATGRRHNGNWHAHIMLSACHVAPTGQLGKKAVELDPIHCQRAKIENMADRERVRWAQLANGALERASHSQRVDHRTLAAQGIDREPTKHLGPAATGFERRTGELSNKRLRHELAATAAERLAIAHALGEIEREQQTVSSSIFDLSCDLDTAQKEVHAERGNATALLQSGATRFVDRLAAQREQAARNAAELQRQATAQRTTQEAAKAKTAAQEAAKSLLQRCSQHAVECSLNKFKMNSEMMYGDFEIEAILHRATRPDDKRDLENWFNKQSLSDNPIDVVLGLAGRAANINRNSEFHTDLIKILNDAGIQGATPERIAAEAAQSAEEAALKNRERNNDISNDNDMGM